VLEHWSNGKESRQETGEPRRKGIMEYWNDGTMV
jgi:hypothetical protein